MKIFSSTTDTILFVLTIAIIVFTFLGITDPKDFYAFLSSVAAFKFGKWQGVNNVDSKQG